MSDPTPTVGTVTAPGPLERLATRITAAVTRIQTTADVYRRLSNNARYSREGRDRFLAQAAALDVAVDLLRVALRNDITDDATEDDQPRWRTYHGPMPHLEHERLELPRKDATHD